MSQVSPLIETQNLEAMARKTSNVYESLAVISRRANQISTDLKSELHSKLEDFATHTDQLEEVVENREQIEISKFYERLPHPTILATKEFNDEQLAYRYDEAQ